MLNDKLSFFFNGEFQIEIRILKFRHDIQQNRSDRNFQNRVKLGFTGQFV